MELRLIKRDKLNKWDSAQNCLIFVLFHLSQKMVAIIGKICYTNNVNKILANYKKTNINT